MRHEWCPGGGVGPNRGIRWFKIVLSIEAVVKLCEVTGEMLIADSMERPLKYVLTLPIIIELRLTTLCWLQ